MRPVALLLLLLAACAAADVDVSPEQRKRDIAVAASVAAARLGRAEHYVPYLDPVPKRMLSADEMVPYVLFGDGWGTRKAKGIWTRGFHSTLYLRLAPGQHPKQLFIHGGYYKGAEATRLLVNGQLLSEAPLQGLTVTLPENLATASQLTIELQHLNPQPLTNVQSGSATSYKIKFQLKQLRVW